MQNITSASTPESLAVNGLIFDTNNPVSTNTTFPHPQIISEATRPQSDTIFPYTYNYDTTSTATNPNYITQYRHIFEENCYVLNPIVPAYYVISGLWGLIAIFYSIFVLLQPTIHRISLTKSLILFPTLKALEVVLEGLWLGFCPWVTMNSSAY